MGSYSFSGSPTFITIGVTGTYDLDAFGAQGGSDQYGRPGGLGAEEGGFFNFTAGQVLEIIVGGSGGTAAAGSYGGGGGGGGTFVFLKTGTGTYQNLLVAGGGGGAYKSAGGNGTVAAAGAGTGGSAGGYNFSGGGGAGVSAPGATGGGRYNGGGGSTQSGGFAGGAPASGLDSRKSGSGGFGGGGGGGYSNGGGGGGGGFTGGNGGYGGSGTGGTSYDAGTPIAAQTKAGVRSGNGQLAITVVCYCAGTLIQTGEGEVAVEHLRAGDRVVTLSGALQPVVWIGRRSYDAAHIGAGCLLPRTAWPVRVAAGAFGPGLPHTDLRVSGNHALYHDGVLIPAFCLVNGTTIREEPASAVDYFHIELPAHNVVLANGMPSESWLDTDNRRFFDNAPVTALHRPASDAFLLAGTGHCVPCLTEGRQVIAARHAAHAHALALGWTYTQEPDVHVLADGLRIDAAWHDGRVVCFDVPPGIADLRLASRATRTMDRAPESPDFRTLGIAIDALRLDGAPLELAALEDQEGWWSIERDGTDAWRWTGGAAVLPAGVRKVMASIAHVSTYLVAPQACRRPAHADIMSANVNIANIPVADEPRS